MADYQSQTVAQLKEALKAKNLSTAGVKADLVARLTESDNVVETTETSLEKPQETEPEKESIPKTEESTLKVIQPQEKEEPKEADKPKVLTPEGRKAIDFINKKINRAKKFGNEQEIKNFEKDRARIEKFGVELGTTLAKEIGLIDHSLSNNSFKNSKFKNTKFKKRFRNKN